jgi:hypothetical protein
MALSEYKKQWNKENRDKVLEHQRQYRLRNREKLAQERAARSRAKREQETAYAREWRAKNPEKVKEITRRHRLKKNFGITLDDYERLLREQKGVCAICASPPRGRWTTLVVDHCHDGGGVRGLLCSSCNAAIGALGDSPDGLRKALAYLERC